VLLKHSPTCHQAVDRRERVEVCELECRLVEALSGEPVAMGDRPRTTILRIHAPVAQEQLRDAMACPHQVLPQCLARTHEIACGLLRDARQVDRAQRPGHQQPYQQLRVALIGLDPIGRRAWCLPRRDEHHLDTRRRCCACEPEAGRTRLVHRLHRPALLGEKANDLLDLTAEPLSAQLARLRIDERRVHATRVDVETDPCHRLTHPAGPSSGCGQPEPTTPARQTRELHSEDPTGQPPPATPQAIGSNRMRAPGWGVWSEQGCRPARRSGWTPS
jgi:hypothetical protein